MGYGIIYSLVLGLMIANADLLLIFLSNLSFLIMEEFNL